MFHFNINKKKKIISGILIGFGIGIILALFLPLKAWLAIIRYCFNYLPE